jgi:hypothetical protein
MLQHPVCPPQCSPKGRKQLTSTHRSVHGSGSTPVPPSFALLPAVLGYVRHAALTRPLPCPFGVAGGHAPALFTWTAPVWSGIGRRSA